MSTPPRRDAPVPIGTRKPVNPQPDPALAGLAREVELLHRRLDELGKLPDRVRELGAMVAKLADALAPTGQDVPSSPPAPSWLAHPCDHSDRAAPISAAKDLLTSLGEWVREVYLRYDDAASKFPDCWLWHPGVVEELLWLRGAWLTAYAPAAPKGAVGDWHDRQRPMVVRRIRDYAGVCSLEAHTPGRGQHRPAPRIPHPEAIEAIAEWWTTRRAEPGPTPSEEQLSRHDRQWLQGSGRS